MDASTRIAWWTKVRDLLMNYKRAIAELEDEEIIQLNMDDSAYDLLQQAKRALGEEDDWE